MGRGVSDDPLRWSIYDHRVGPAGWDYWSCPKCEHEFRRVFVPLEMVIEAVEVVGEVQPWNICDRCKLRVVALGGTVGERAVSRDETGLRVPGLTG